MYHLELGSEGHSFHGKAIVVNSQTGEHKSSHPIPLQNAQAQMRVLEAAHKEESAPEPAPKKKFVIKEKIAIPIPRINSLPQDMRRSMTDKLAGMEDTHEYKLGFGHPIEYILRWIEKFKHQERYWGKSFDIAYKFFNDVERYVKAKANDATWDGEPTKMILVDDYGKIFK